MQIAIFIHHAMRHISKGGFRFFSRFQIAHLESLFGHQSDPLDVMVFQHRMQHFPHLYVKEVSLMSHHRYMFFPGSITDACCQGLQCFTTARNSHGFAGFEYERIASWAIIDMKCHDILLSLPVAEKIRWPLTRDQVLGVRYCTLLIVILVRLPCSWRCRPPVEPLLYPTLAGKIRPKNDDLTSRRSFYRYSSISIYYHMVRYLSI